jgi:redox-sensitive bicupin YhaK (pirin superfamily)
MMATIEQPILQTIQPVTHDLGAFKVNRTLPSRERTMVGPFIFVDEFGPARLPAGQGMDVRPHPHINLATVTYLFEGAIEHRDSIGSHQVIEPGAINLMTAGKGIVHSERSPAEIRAQGPSLYGMQTWLALPDGREEVDPAFDHVPEGGLPLIEADGVSARVLMGTLWGATAATPQHSPTIYADIELSGSSIPIDSDADERGIRRGDMCSGTSSPPRATGSTRRRMTGSRGACRSRRATTRSSSRFPRNRSRSAIRDGVPAGSAQHRRDAERCACGRPREPARDPAPRLSGIAPHLA